MDTAKQKKHIAVFNPVERSRKLLGELLEGFGYRVALYAHLEDLTPCTQGPDPADLIILRLSILGESYPLVIEELTRLGWQERGAPLLIGLTILRLSQEARQRLEQLGVQAVLADTAPLLELIFTVNRLLFPKIRELRRYARVFGGFPVECRFGDKCHPGHVYNICQQGAFIQCETPPPEDTRIDVRFVLPDQETKLEIQAQVNWVNDAPRDQGLLSPRGMGVNFLTLGHAETTYLGRFIEERVNGNDLTDGVSSSSS